MPPLTRPSRSRFAPYRFSAPIRGPSDLGRTSRSSSRQPALFIGGCPLGSVGATAYNEHELLLRSAVPRASVCRTYTTLLTKMVYARRSSRSCTELRSRAWRLPHVCGRHQMLHDDFWPTYFTASHTARCSSFRVESDSRPRSLFAELWPRGALHHWVATSTVIEARRISKNAQQTNARFMRAGNKHSLPFRGFISTYARCGRPVVCTSVKKAEA